MATRKRGLQYPDDGEIAEATETTAKPRTLADVYAETENGAKVDLRAPDGSWWRYTRTSDGYERDTVPGFYPGPEHSFVQRKDFDKYEWRER